MKFKSSFDEVVAVGLHVRADAVTRLVECGRNGDGRTLGASLDLGSGAEPAQEAHVIC